MKTISPTYLGGHTYDRYEVMSKSLEEAFTSNSELTIDLDFLHSKEIAPYIKDILVKNITHEFYVQSKSRERAKKIIRIFKDCLVVFGLVEENEGFYTIKVYR